MKTTLLLLVCILFSVLTQGQNIRRNISETYFNNLTFEQVQKWEYKTKYVHMKCGNYGIVNQKVTNSGNRPFYIQSYRVITCGNHVVYNPSVDNNGNGGVMIFNRQELEIRKWQIKPGETVLVLTTAEHVKGAHFKYDWYFDKPYVSSGYKYSIPNYRVDKSVSIINPRKEPDYDAEIIGMILCDYDDNIDTASDNFLLIASTRIIIEK